MSTCTCPIDTPRGQLVCVLNLLTHFVTRSHVRYTLPEHRKNVLIIPTSYLEKRDGSHYYAKVRPYPYPYPYPNHTLN